MVSVQRIQDSFKSVLTPLGAAYALGMRVRAWAYRRGLFSVWKPPVPCVSVGNIGWGGTGKTPLAGWFLGWAIGRGHTPALLTRGYGAKPRSLPHLVTRGSLAEESGDEPLMLARWHPEARIVVDPVRSRGGQWALEQSPADLLVLDDGFQHMAVARDLNLVLLTPRDIGAGWNRVIPAGSWREGVSALGRADAFLIKAGARQFAQLKPALRHRLGHLGKPVFSFRLVPTGVRPVLGGMARPDLEGAPYLLVTGVGDPEQVAHTARKLLGNPPKHGLTYPDHHMFTKADADHIKNTARHAGCEYVLCTAKDAVKLGPMAGENFFMLEVDLAFGGSLMTTREFPRWWERRFNTLRVRAGLDTPEPDLPNPFPAPPAEESVKRLPDPEPEPEDDVISLRAKLLEDAGLDVDNDQENVENDKVRLTDEPAARDRAPEPGSGPGGEEPHGPPQEEDEPE